MKIELPEADIYAGVDKEAIIKVLSNLFSNALKYAGTYAHLYLSADDEESSLLIVMDNDGEVIPLEMRDNIFLPLCVIGMGIRWNRERVSDWHWLVHWRNCMVGAW